MHPYLGKVVCLELLISLDGQYLRETALGYVPRLKPSLVSAEVAQSTMCTNQPIRQELPFHVVSRSSTVRPPQASSDPTFDELPWYRCWVLQQIRKQPERFFLSLPDFNLNNDPDLSQLAFFQVWDQVRDLILEPGPKSINSIADSIANLGLVSARKNYEAAQSVKCLVFSIVGWQTMLYQPDLPSSSAGGLGHEYNIVDETGGYRGEAHLCLNQFIPTSNKNLPEFLLGFGMMLPPQNYCGFDDPDDRSLFNSTKTVASKDLNAHVLTKICGITIHWVDSLSCHLELDRQSGRLFLYRYPSFCVSSLKQHSDSRKSPLHRCAFEGKNGPVPWGSEEDTSGLLREILLSYRLIFGHHKRSRAAFRSLQPFARDAPQLQDQLLPQLCGRKRFDNAVIPSSPLVERDQYDLAGDFPHLRSRIVRLHSYASSKKPRSIKELWGDTRDSTAWLALWSVLIFGSVTVFFALIQTVFQILQYVDGKGG